MESKESNKGHYYWLRNLSLPIVRVLDQCIHTSTATAMALVPVGTVRAVYPPSSHPSLSPYLIQCRTTRRTPCALRKISYHSLQEDRFALCHITNFTMRLWSKFTRGFCLPEDSPASFGKLPMGIHLAIYNKLEARLKPNNCVWSLTSPLLMV